MARLSRGSRTYRDTVVAHLSAYYWDEPWKCRELRGRGGLFTEEVPVSVHSDVNHFLGRRIWDNVPVAYAFYSLLPPNSPSCGNHQNGWMAASSAHSGGVNVSFLDGVVRFIPDTIHTNLYIRNPKKYWEHESGCTGGTGGQVTHSPCDHVSVTVYGRV